MAMENRNPEPGTKLVTRYKGQTHTCGVVKTAEGIRYRLADGREFKSPSSAGRGVTGRVSCDGWKFWALEGQEPPAPEGRATRENVDDSTGKTAKGKKLLRQIKRVPNQKGVAEGQTKFFCSSCMSSFVAPSDPLPDACPEGHAREVEDTLAPVS